MILGPKLESLPEWGARVKFPCSWKHKAGEIKTKKQKESNCWVATWNYSLTEMREGHDAISNEKIVPIYYNKNLLTQKHTQINQG